MVETELRRDGIARREAILDAALACFVERGVLATGIEDVRKAAGASPSSMYHLFDGGMPGLMAALLRRTFTREFTYLAARVKEAKTAEAAVMALVDGHLDWVFRHRAESRVMYQAMSLELTRGATEALMRTKAELVAPIAKELGRFVASGDLPAWSPLVYDVVLLGPSHEACRRFLAGAELDPKWMRATFPRLAWHSISAIDELEPKKQKSKKQKKQKKQKKKAKKS